MESYLRLSLSLLALAHIVIDMESYLRLGLSLLALAHIAIAISLCPVDVVFIVDSSECISRATFQKEKEFVKQASEKLGVAPGQSRAAIIQFFGTVEITVELGQYPTKQQFEGAVDGLKYELPTTPMYHTWTTIYEALDKAAQDIFLKSETSNRRIAILLTDGKQLIGAREVTFLTTAYEDLRKLGVRLLAVTMGTSSSALDKILKLVTERDEDLVMESQGNDLLNKLPSMIACGSCVCTSGDSYITIKKYKSKKKRSKDDIRFEFKSHMSGHGLIMSAQGKSPDYVEVNYEDRRLWYNINLGSGEKKVSSIQQLNNGNRWHQVHITRNKQSVKMNIKNADGDSLTPAITPGDMKKLNLPASKGYFLGAPEKQRLLPNFVGCIRYFTVDGYEPVFNAWANNPETSIVKGSMRLCTASDEMQS